MNSHFLQGFTDELVKTGGVPMVGKIRQGATLLGQKVRSMTNSVVKRARGIRAESKGGEGLKTVTKPKGIRPVKTAADLLAGVKLADDADGDGDGDEGGSDEVLRAIMREAEARINDESNEQGYNDQQADGADDPSYGAGQGMPKKKPAKPKHPMI